LGDGGISLSAFHPGRTIVRRRRQPPAGTSPKRICIRKHRSSSS